MTWLLIYIYAISITFSEVVIKLGGYMKPCSYAFLVKLSRSGLTTLFSVRVAFEIHSPDGFLAMMNERYWQSNLILAENDISFTEFKLQDISDLR